MFDRFKGYAKFTKEYLGGHLPFSNEHYFYVRRLELALAREVGRLDLVAHAQAGLAHALEKEGRPAEALPLAEEALGLRERLRDRDLGRTRDLVARLRKKVGK